MELHLLESVCESQQRFSSIWPEEPRCPNSLTFSWPALSSRCYVATESPRQRCLNRRRSGSSSKVHPGSCVTIIVSSGRTTIFKGWWILLLTESKDFERLRRLVSFRTFQGMLPSYRNTCHFKILTSRGISLKHWLQCLERLLSSKLSSVWSKNLTLDFEC